MAVSSTKVADVAPGSNLGHYVRDIQDKKEPATRSLMGDTMDHLMHKWSVLEALQLYDQPIETIRKYYFCADHDVEKFKTTDHRISGFMKSLGDRGEVSHVWTYIEIDGGKHITLTDAMRERRDLVERHENMARRPARVIVARGLVVAKPGSNTGRGSTVFGGIALGLMSKLQGEPGFDFAYVLGAQLKYEAQDRFHVENSLDEPVWVSHAHSVRFRGAGVDVLDGSLS